MRLSSAVIVSIVLLAVPAAASADYAGGGASLLVSSPGALGAVPSQGVNRAGIVSPLDETDTVATSTNGRYSVFASQSDGLSATDDNRFSNVFRKDRTTGAIVLISQSSGGVGANDYSYGASISDDGNLVAFTSAATNLAAADTDAGHDAFVRNVSAGTTALLSVGSTDCVAPVGGATANAECGRVVIAGDGQSVAYASLTSQALADNNNVLDVYRRPVVGGGPSLVSQVESNPGKSGNGASYAPSIDDSGAHVAFLTRATDLSNSPVVTDTNGGPDVYVRTMATADEQLVSGTDNSAAQTLDGASQAPHISGNGLVVAFATLGQGADGQASDTDGNFDTYLRTLSTNANDLVSRATGLAGTKANGYYSLPLSLSTDGQWILFSSNASNLGGTSAPDYNVYARRFIPGVLGTTIAMSSGPAGASSYSAGGAISGDASRALIVSSSTLDATPRDTAEVYERTVSGPPGAADVVSRPAGSGVYAASDVGALSADYNAIPRRTSADGRYVLFLSESDGLPDANLGYRVVNVYRRDVITGALELVSRADGAGGASGNGYSQAASISADGSRVVFVSDASSLGAPAGHNEAFVRDFATQTTTLVSRGGGGTPDDGVSGAEISSDGRRVAYIRYAGGHDHVVLRDLADQTSTQVDRADGASGALAPDDADANTVSIDGTGQRVVFTTTAKLDPADSDTNNDVYVRDVAAGTTQLVSRADGAAGAKTTKSIYDAEISADGRRVAFATLDPALATEAGAWPANTYELVVRDLVAQTTRLVSRGPSGPAGSHVGDYAMDATGDAIAFTSEASNLVAGAGGPGASLFVHRMSSGETSAVAVWHDLPSGDIDGASSPGLSAGGQCVVYDAQGTGPVDVSPDFVNTYVTVLPGGACPDPTAAVPPGVPSLVDPGQDHANQPPHVDPAAGAPKVSKLKVTSKKFMVAPKKKPKKKAKSKTKVGTAFAFTLSAKAAVTITLERKTVGRKKTAKRCVKVTRKLAKKKKCTLYVKAGTLPRVTRPAGPAKVAFTGRIGKKALRPGAYRATVVATAGGKSSAPATVAFTVVRR